MNSPRIVGSQLAKAAAKGKGLLITNHPDGPSVLHKVGHGWAEVIEDRPGDTKDPLLDLE